ncbi:nucleotidyltransferase family protein [Flexithrix dorotheae]|uniref:nucleotidyltransferase family protein n=1 Tax=Flexithrix dorotheae TaxID=70993 RepID=UPI00039E849B|nr:nucleotidyltransferase family protein [Flexithrix dorotheae]
MQTKKCETGIIILAAGSSSRLGQPKQLLKLEEETLIRRISKTALKSNLGKVVVVLGGHSEKIKPEIEDLDLHFTLNEAWEEGMSSSIKAGLKTLLKENEKAFSSVLFLVCDQPYVDTKLLNTIISKQVHSGKDIVASKYQNGIIGVPVMFSSKYFTNLLQLKGKEGAKTIIKSFPQEVATISFNKGDLDIDTISDWENIIKNFKQKS